MFRSCIHNKSLLNSVCQEENCEHALTGADWEVVLMESFLRPASTVFTYLEGRKESTLSVVLKKMFFIKNQG